MDATAVINARTVVIHERQRLAKALVDVRCTALSVPCGGAAASSRELFVKVPFPFAMELGGRDHAAAGLGERSGRPCCEMYRHERLLTLVPRTVGFSGAKRNYLICPKRRRRPRIPPYAPPRSQPLSTYVAALPPAAQTADLVENFYFLARLPCWERPWATAHAASWAREPMPSLPRILLTWISAV